MATPHAASRERWMFALAGLLAGLGGLAFSSATSWVLSTRTTPLLAVSEGIRDLAPGGLATWLVHLVGRLDKPLLVAGTALVVMVACAWAGTLARRHLWRSDLVFLALAAIGLVFVIRSAEPQDGLSVLLGLLAMLVILRVLVAPLRAGDAGAGGRRAFLRRTGLVLLGGVVVVGIGRFAGRSRRLVEESRRLVRLPGTQGTVPRGAQLSVDGLQPWRTPAADFYRIDTALAPPSVRPEDWQLRVHGLVDHEVTYSYAELLEQPPVEAWLTLACVSNPVGGDLVGNGWWTGVPVRTVLERAGVLDSADAVLQTSADGWTCVTPIQALTDDRNALLAYAMNGRPLLIEHGFPVRMVVPGLYGYVSGTKWVVDLKVTRFDRDEGYWTPRGWSELGPIKTQSRIDVPRNHSEVSAGQVRVGGVAWAQHRGIAKVEYALDNDPWREAVLGRVPGADTWVQWSGEVEADEGSHELRVRATDGTGQTQTGAVSDVLPDGATGWHTIEFDAKET